MKIFRKIKKKDRKDRSFQERGIPEFPSLFDDFMMREFFTPSFNTTGVSTPAVNVIETTDDFRLEMVAPGMKKESFSIELEEDVLSITYDHEDNRQSDRRDWVYRMHEYNYHSFSRSFTLPEEADTGSISAKYENGILYVTIPKKPEARRKPVRQIVVS